MLKREGMCRIGSLEWTVEKLRVGFVSGKTTYPREYTSWIFESWRKYLFDHNWRLALLIASCIP